MKILAISTVLLLVSLSAAEIVYRSETSAGNVTLLESSGSSRILEFNLPALEVIARIRHQLYQERQSGVLFADFGSNT